MKVRSSLFALLFVLPTCIFAGIVGTYTIKGFDPDPAPGGHYTGTIAISQNGGVYTAQWLFESGETAFGTAVRKDDTLSFVFNEDFGVDYGTQQYKIEGDTLHGPWVRFGENRKGYERLTKIGS